VVATLPEGTSFGELALLNSKPRSATIVTKDQSHFAVLEKTDFQKICKGLVTAAMNQKI
jgi:CRP-like cAMP-binding protein